MSRTFRLGKSSNSYVNNSDMTSRFNDELSEWDCYLSDVRRERNRWRAVSLISLVIVAASLLGWNHAAHLPKSVPLVIEVMPWGESRYAGDISNYSYGGLNVPEAAIRFQVRRFVEQFRQLPSDEAVLRQSHRRLYTMLVRETASYVSDGIRSDEIYSKLGKLRRLVEIESIIRVSDLSWQVDWVERELSMTNAVLSEKRYRAVTGYELQEPPKEHLAENPLGIYITNFDMQEL